MPPEPGSPGTKPLHVRVPLELHRRVGVTARMRGITMQMLVIQALEQYFASDASGSATGDEGTGPAEERSR